MMEPPVVRAARESDLDAINEIYNDWVRDSVFAFDTEETSAEARASWFRAHVRPYSVLVAQTDQRVTGWASISSWAPHGAYSRTAEHSVFVRRDQVGNGIGRALVNSIVDEARTAGLHVLVGRITVGNTASRTLHESLGFVEIGTMREVGWKFGRYLDVWLVQRTISSG